MNFRKIMPEDQSILNEYIKDINNFQTDFSIVTILLFKEFQNPEISIQEKCILIKGYMAGEEVFFAPLCKLENINESLELIISYFKRKDKPYRIVYIQKEYIKEFFKHKNISPNDDFYQKYGYIKQNDYIVFNDRNDAEYIYIPKHLIDLEGNKYKKIREKIRSFNKEYKNYEFIEFNHNYFENIISLINTWNNEKCYDSLYETTMLKYVIDNKEKLNIIIYLLKINNIIAGMTIMQILPNNIGVIIFEKSLSEYKNANCILNIFEVNILKNCRAISRQEDMGIEGLRQSKLSYKPFYLEDKFNLYQYNENEYFLLYKSIFGDSDKLIELIKQSENYNIKHTSFILKKQEIISIGSTREKRLRIFNKIEEIPFIFGVATKVEERKKGYAGEILKKLFNKINFDKYNFVMIAPEEEYLIKYYEKFGFVKFNYVKKISIENLFKKNFDIKIGNINDSKEMLQLFNNYTNKYKISQYRDLKFTIERLKEIFIDDGKLFILSINNINYGYFIYEAGIITEYINLLENEENEKTETIKNILKNKNISYILKCETINKGISIDINNSKNIDTYSLIRIINPINIIKQYLDYIFFEKSDDYNKNRLIKDEIIGDSIFNLKKINNKNYVSMITDNNGINIEISIGDLMQKIIRNFNNYIDDNYIFQDNYFFTEKW